MRIRDAIFPEGSKLRNFLRKINNFIHRLNKRNIKRGMALIKERGLKEAFQAIKNRNNIIPSRVAYQNWIRNNEPNEEELQKQRETKFKINPKISIMVPMYNTPENFFEELVDCLIAQTYPNWELCLADGSTKQNKKLERIYKKDPRIKYKFLNENKGIAGNTNECIKMATGDFIALFDHDDLLPIFSLYEIVKAINENPDVEFIYTDEDKIEKYKENRCDPYFKPDFAPDTLRANNYITHFSVFKKELMDKLGGERSKYDGAQDFDVILRMSEMTNKIVHIPKVLYHWRVHPNSTAQSGGDAKPYAYEAGIRALEDHIARKGWKGKVQHAGDILGVYEIIYELKDTPKIEILIPNKDGIDMLKKCIESILDKTTYPNYEIVVIENNSEKQETFDYYKELEKNDKIKVLYYKEKGFNYSRLINFGVKNTDGEYVMQLNNDTEILTPNWLEKMMGYLQRDDVGAVGPRMYYEDMTIQHAGVIIGIGNLAAHILKGVPHDLHGYFGKEALPQNMSAVTGACLLSKRKIYEEVGYMDEEKFAVAFNDVDFCLKIREKGYFIIYHPFVELMHYESKTRGYEDTKEKIERFNKEANNFRQKWAKILKEGDPYYNKNFRLDTDQYEIRQDKVK